MPAILEARGVTKKFPGVVALDGVDLVVNSGEILCILGENGAGKSTLMKILAGDHRKDSGKIYFDGRDVEINTPADAIKLGIGVIPQDFDLVPELTVAENIFLGDEPKHPNLPFIDIKKMNVGAFEALAQFGEHIEPTVLAGKLSLAKKQFVEIAKAVRRSVRVLALDEPTASLTELEKDALFKVIRRLKSQGVAIIYISHRMEEVYEIGDRVTVLRDGKLVTSSDLKNTDVNMLISWMVGRELQNEYPKENFERGNEALRVENLSTNRLDGISFTVYRGEIFGIAGLVGAGRTELARAIFGASPRTGGKIFLDGKEIKVSSPRDAIDAGIGLLPEDRNRYGVIAGMTVRENISLANLNELTKGIFIDRKEDTNVAKKFIEQLKFRPPYTEISVEKLSGGTRQKVILSRWLFAKSKLMIFDEPTAGVDVGTKHEIYKLLNRLVRDGIGIIVISSDLPELLGISDRIAVMCEGRMTGILARSEATQENIMALAVGTAEEIVNGN